MRTTYYIAAALAALNLANAISITAASSRNLELEQFSSELAQIDSELAVFTDSELASYTEKGGKASFVPSDVADINDMLQGGH